jgi:hypothetical protein
MGPFADLKKIGLPLTFLNALTGEFTPPGIRIELAQKAILNFFFSKMFSNKFLIASDAE